jgi:hypothetical protein
MKTISKISLIAALLASSSAFAGVADIAAYAPGIEAVDMLTAAAEDMGATIIQTSDTTSAAIVQPDPTNFAIIVQSIGEAFATINQTGATGSKAIIIQGQ